MAKGTVGLEAEKKSLEKRLKDINAELAKREENLSLFKVKVDGMLIVLASSPAKAKDVAESWVGEEPSVKYSVTPIRSAKDVPKAWLNAVPYEGTSSYDERLSETTVKKMLKK